MQRHLCAQEQQGPTHSPQNVSTLCAEFANPRLWQAIPPTTPRPELWGTWRQGQGLREVKNNRRRQQKLVREQEWGGEGGVSGTAAGRSLTSVYQRPAVHVATNGYALESICSALMSVHSHWATMPNGAQQVPPDHSNVRKIAQ